MQQVIHYWKGRNWRFVLHILSEWFWMSCHLSLLIACLLSALAVLHAAEPGLIANHLSQGMEILASEWAAEWNNDLAALTVFGVFPGVVGFILAYAEREDDGE